MQSMRVAIIGGGFTGTILAVHLLRAATRPLDVVIVENREALGRGVAYGTELPEHRVNVPSVRMAVFDDDRTHFARWMLETGRQKADPDGMAPDGHHYGRRRDFAAYLDALLWQSLKSAENAHNLAHCRAVATGIERAESGGFTITLSSSEAIHADLVVITTSYGAPSLPWPVDPATADLRLVRDPWTEAALVAIKPKDRVLMIGTGLTMADMTISLRRQGHRGDIMAISRHGLLPLPHGEFDSTYDFLANSDLPMTAGRLLHHVRDRVDAMALTGRCWHPVIDSIRRQLPTFWPLLPLEERARIVKRLRAFWDVHRFRIAPQVQTELEEHMARGGLSLTKGRILSVMSSKDGYAVSWMPSGGSIARTDVFDAVVNCTGPTADVERSENPLFRSLLKTGLGRRDPLRLGIDVDASSSVIDDAGRPVDGLFIAGPLARGRFGETTGAPDASNHARTVAHLIVAMVETQASRF